MANKRFEEKRRLPYDDRLLPSPSQPLPLQVQIRPWNLSDSDFVMDGSQPLDPRKTIFVGGVPRPLRAGNDTMETFFVFNSLKVIQPAS